MTECNFTPIEYNGQRVLITIQLAKAYGTTGKRISENFTRNRERFIEGVHFYRLRGEEKHKFFNHHQIEDGLNATYFYLWTAKGSHLHATILHNHKAYEGHNYLSDNYFMTSNTLLSVSPKSTENQGKIEIHPIQWTACTYDSTDCRGLRNRRKSYIKKL